jgi:hypothetical protein
MLGLALVLPVLTPVTIGAAAPYHAAIALPQGGARRSAGPPARPDATIHQPESPTMRDHHETWQRDDAESPRRYWTRPWNFDDDEPLERPRRRPRPRHHIEDVLDEDHRDAAKHRAREQLLADQMADHRFYGEMFSEDELGEVFDEEWVTYRDDAAVDDDDWPYD